MTDSLFNQRYQLGELLGEGAWGIVRAALDLQTNTRVAIKILKSEAIFSLPHAVERFNREASILTRLNHPHIVKIYEACADVPPHYIVMEYVSGGSLRQMMDSTPLMNVRQAISITLQIATALMSIHDQYVVHRDLKPSNILFAEDHTVRLTDFGLVRIPGLDSITEVGNPLGTMHYIAPELFKGELADERTDIWSLGIILAEMLLGKPPFDGRNFTHILMSIIRDPVPDVGTVRTDCLPEVMELLQQMLAKERNERIAHATLLCECLDNILQALS